MSDRTNKKRVKTPGDISSLFDYDYSSFSLKPDHLEKPIWVCPNRHIFLQSSCSSYLQVTDFLIAISEPRSRPENIHEYELTRYSLYAAVSVKLEPEYIVTVLQTYNKMLCLPEEVISFIFDSTAQCGRAKLVLRNNMYFIESAYEGVLKDLEKIESVRQAKNLATGVKADIGEVHLEDINEEMNKMMDGENVELGENVESMPISSDLIEQVRKDCQDQNFPLIEEYDFFGDDINPKLEIDLKPSTHIRPYQEKSLSKMFSNGRARSGVIVLPCGSGKTLVGITAICTVKKRAIILCTSCVAVDQWKRQLELWSTIDPKQIFCFTSNKTDLLENNNKPCIVISTYSMMGFTGKRRQENEDMYNKMKEVEWGLLVMDEVQVVPADVFRRVIFDMKSHCKLGLTATLVREDNKIDDLNFLIGPKLYEANWLELQASGFIAKVECIEVWCPMTAEFFQEYLDPKNSDKKILLYVANPNKLMTCEYLVRKHEKMGDKIIIFSDNLFVLELYKEKFNLPMICGSTPHKERTDILFNFQNKETHNTILVSKVGDTSIDLPGANVIIQISSHFGSRRQEAQRLGRILRPKTSGSENEFNAYFYSLVSQDTLEMKYADKRQMFLVDQGYAFRVMSLSEEIKEHRDLRFASKEEQKKLLDNVFNRKCEDEVLSDPDDITPERISRKTGNTFATSTSASSVRSVQVERPRNKLFAQRYKLLKK